MFYCTHCYKAVVMLKMYCTFVNKNLMIFLKNTVETLKLGQVKVFYRTFWSL